MTTPIHVAVTGAGGQIGYALIFRIASGAIFGPEQPVSLGLLEITPALPSLGGTLMELEDCAFPLLAGVKATDKPEEAFAKANWVILVGGLIDLKRVRQHEQSGATMADYLDLAVNSSYTYVVFGLAAFTFAFGGMAYWLPKYLEQVKGFTHARAGDIVSLTAFPAAIVGMTGGGWLADRLSKRNPKALFQVSGLSMLLAVPCILGGLYSGAPALIIAWLFLAQALLFANTGPSNAVIANVVDPKMRATAYAIMTLAIHFLGDVWSPMLMGWVSDLCGKPDTMASTVGRILAAIGAVPVNGRNLTAGMLIVVPTVLLGGMVLLAGARHLPREMALMLARLKAAPKGALE